MNSKKLPGVTVIVVWLGIGSVFPGHRSPDLEPKSPSGHEDVLKPVGAGMVIGTSTGAGNFYQGSPTLTSMVGSPYWSSFEVFRPRIAWSRASTNGTRCA